MGDTTRELQPEHGHERQPDEREGAVERPAPGHAPAGPLLAGGRLEPAAHAMQLRRTAAGAVRGAHRLQRAYGNRYTARVAATTRQPAPPVVQARLVVTPAGDRYEQEADRVAEAVVGRLGSSQQAVAGSGAAVQRAPEPARSRDDEAAVQRAPAISTIQRAGGGAGEAVTPETQASIAGARGGGEPLAADLRGELEGAFGRDFGTVRVHTGARADGLNRELQARAFTTGSDIFFRQGEYQPGSQAGRRLLAHELTHVVQQGGGAGALQRWSSDPLDTRKPIDWFRETATVTRPGSGVSGGVFFAQDAQARKIVVKPILHNDPEQSQFADAVLSEGFGIRTPDSRIVARARDEGEFFNLAALIQAHGEKMAPTDTTRLRDAIISLAKGADPEGDAARWAEDPQQYNGPVDKKTFLAYLGKLLEGTRAFKLMRLAEGRSLADWIEDATTAQGFDDLVALLGRPGVLFQIGRLMVADAIIGNEDRFSMGQSNFGNLFITANGQLTAIDSDATLNRLEEAQISGIQKLEQKGATIKAALITDLVKGQDTSRLVGAFLSSIEQKLQRIGATGDLAAQLDRQEMERQLHAGIRAGKRDIFALLSGKSNAERTRRARMQGEATTRYGAKGASASVDWNTFKLRVRYLEEYEQRGDKPDTHEQAARATADYARLRLAKASLVAPSVPPYDPALNNVVQLPPPKSKLRRGVDKLGYGVDRLKRTRPTISGEELKDLSARLANAEEVAKLKVYQPKSMDLLAGLIQDGMELALKTEQLAGAYPPQSSTYQKAMLSAQAVRVAIRMQETQFEILQREKEIPSLLSFLGGSASTAEQRTARRRLHDLRLVVNWQLLKHAADYLKAAEAIRRQLPGLSLSQGSFSDLDQLLRTLGTDLGQARSKLATAQEQIELYFKLEVQDREEDTDEE